MAYKARVTPLVTNYIYLFHTDEWLLLPEYPDSVSDKLSSTFAQTNALSRTAPIYTYSYSGPRTVQIQLHLHRDILDDINIENSNIKLEPGEDYMDVLLKKIQSAVLPVYNETNKEVKVPRVAIKLGNDIFIKGIINGGISIDYQKPILDDERYANVTLNFDVFETAPYDAESVAVEGSFRGITQTFRQGIYKD